VRIKKLKLIRRVSLGFLVVASLVTLTACGGGKNTNPMWEKIGDVTPEIRPVVPPPHNHPL
jgi:hypothetical protein